METNEIYAVGDIRAIPDEALDSELRTIEQAFNSSGATIIGTNMLLASIARSLARLEAQGRQGGY